MILVVDDDTERYKKDIECANYSSSEYNFIFATGLESAIEQIQNPDNAFYAAVLDIYFDIHNPDSVNGSMSEFEYGWLLVPLVYEYHPRCIITINSACANSPMNFKKSFFGYNVGNVFPSGKLDISNTIELITSRRKNIVANQQAKINNYKPQITNNVQGLKPMEAVILELSNIVEAQKGEPYTFDYNKTLKLKKGSDELIGNDKRNEQLRKIKAKLVNLGVINESEKKTIKPSELIETLVKHNYLIDFSIMGIQREKFDEEWIALIASEKMSGRDGRDVCTNLYGKGQNNVYKHVENIYNDIFEKDKTSKKPLMCQRLCKYFKIDYSESAIEILISKIETRNLQDAKQR